MFYWGQQWATKKEVFCLVYRSRCSWMGISLCKTDARTTTAQLWCHMFARGTVWSLRSHFKPSLSNLGYNGVSKKWTGDKLDDCNFFKSGRLESVDTTDVEYFQPKGERLLNRDNIGLLAKFANRNRPEKLLCVATTHLLYNPRRVNVRLAQIAMMLKVS